MPSITIVVPIYNEEMYIRDFIESLLPLPSDFSLSLIDGGSDDNTIDIISEYTSGDRISLMHNNKRNQADALNLALISCSSEFVTRLDCHALVERDKYYAAIRCQLAKLNENICCLVGFKQRFGYKTKFQHAVALLSITPFLSGFKAYRYTNIEKETDDTFWLFLGKRQLLIDIGGFRSDSVPNEDFELNKRMQDYTGLDLVIAPQVPVYYFPRLGVFSLWRQYYRYGSSKIYSLKMHRKESALRLRSMMLMFILTVISLIILTLAEGVFIKIVFVYLACVITTIFLGHIGYYRDPHRFVHRAMKSNLLATGCSLFIALFIAPLPLVAFSVGCLLSPEIK